MQNVIQGVYPTKPRVRDDLGAPRLSIMGNEGTAVVEGFSPDGQVEHLFNIGDRGQSPLRRVYGRTCR